MQTITQNTNQSADLTAWIAWAFRPSKRGRRRCHEDSYALKHRAENQLRRPSCAVTPTIELSYHW